MRTRPSRDAIKFTVDIEQLLSATDSGDNEEILKCLSLSKKEAGISGLAAEGGAEDPNKRDNRYESITVTTEEELSVANRLRELNAAA